MRTITLQIAGTSSGGSSYATRLLKAISENPVGTKIIAEIGEGEYQDSVYRIVLNAALLIEVAASTLSDSECSFNFQIKKVKQ